jgi:hypothetical protein
VFQLNLDSFCDLINEWIHGMVLINCLKRSKVYLRFYENFKLILMSIEYVVSVNSQTLVPLSFESFILCLVF